MTRFATNTLSAVAAIIIASVSISAVVAVPPVEASTIIAAPVLA